MLFLVMNTLQAPFHIQSFLFDDAHTLGVWRLKMYPCFGTMKEALKLLVPLGRSWTLLAILLQTSAQIANKSCAIVTIMSLHLLSDLLSPSSQNLVLVV